MYANAIDNCLLSTRPAVSAMCGRGSTLTAVPRDNRRNDKKKTTTTTRKKTKRKSNIIINVYGNWTISGKKVS